MGKRISRETCVPEADCHTLVIELLWRLIVFGLEEASTPRSVATGARMSCIWRCERGCEWKLGRGRLEWDERERTGQVRRL